MKRLIILLSILIATVGCNMQEHFSFVEPNEIIVLETNVTDTTYYPHMVNAPQTYIAIDGLSVAIRGSSDFANKTEVNDIIFLANKEDSSKNVTMKAQDIGEDAVLGKPLIFNGYSDFTVEDADKMKYINITKMLNEPKFLINNSLYEKREVPLFFYTKSRCHEVGDYVFTYDSQNDRLGNFYKKIKDNSLNSTRYQSVKIATAGVESVTDGIRFVTIDGYPVKFHLYASDNLPYFRGDIGCWVAVKDMNIYYLFDMDSEFFDGHFGCDGSTKQHENFFTEASLTDANYWQPVPLEEVFAEISRSNPYKCVDRGLDTRTYMPNGGHYTLKVSDYNFDQIALSNVATKAVSIKFFNKDNIEIESEQRYIIPGMADSFATSEAFLEHCNDNTQERSTFREIPILLSKTYDYTKTTIKITFCGESWIGNFMAGKTIPLPCTSSSAERAARLANELEINKLSGLGAIRRGAKNFNLLETRLTFKYSSYKEAKQVQPIIESYIGYLVFFNAIRFKDSTLQDIHAGMSHSGVVLDTLYHFASNSVDVVLHQLNNTQKES